MEEKVTMDLMQPKSDKHFCYVRCSFCNNVLAVEIPRKRLMMDCVTVKCGHCNNLSFMNTSPLPLPLHAQCCFHNPTNFQGVVCKNGQSSLASSSTTSSEPLSPKPHHVVKPPERKHRRPTAYNRFMREEIQRIKAANPGIPHREAFSAAAKNWARIIPNAGSI